MYYPPLPHPRPSIRDDSWPFRKKWAATLVVSAYTFMCPASSSMMAPASDAIAAKFGETNPTVVALFTSIFVCGFGAWFLPLRSEERGLTGT